MDQSDDRGVPQLYFALSFIHLLDIREDVVLSLGGALLLRTKRGTHIAYNEGSLGQGNYMSRVALDFLESARAEECKLD